MKKKMFRLTIMVLGLAMISLNTQTAECSNNGNWKLIGPGGGGQITSITEDPSNPDNLYMTINIGGARRSTNGGATWNIINRGFDYKNGGKSAQKMMDIAVHPNDSNVVLAAGLKGDIYAWNNSKGEWEPSYEHPSAGQLDFDDRYAYSRFVFDPVDSDIVYISIGDIQKLILGVGAAKTGKFWPEIEYGPTIIKGNWDGNKWNWKEIGSISRIGRGGGNYLNIYSIGINPSNANELFFVTEKGLYTGYIAPTTGKITYFTLITQGLPDSNDIHGGKIIFDKGNPGIAYLTLLNLDDKNGSGGVFKSFDYGKNWVRLTNGLDAHPNYFDIQIDPKNSGTIYAAQFHRKNKALTADMNGTIYRSEDFGLTWKDLVKNDKSNIHRGWEHAKQTFGAHFISISKYNNVVRWNRGGKLFESDDISKAYPEWTNILTKKVGTDEWTTAGSEAIAIAHSIAIDPYDSKTIYIPYGDHCYFKSTNGGDSLSILADNKDIKGAGNKFDTGTFIIDEIDSNRIYAATQGPHQDLKDGGVMYSKDAGQNWATIGGHLNLNKQRGLPRGAMTDLLVEYAGVKRNLYVANYGKSGVNPNTQGGVYFLNDVDGANNWKLIFSKNKIRGIAVRDNFNTLFLGVDNKYLFKLTRSGPVWIQDWKKSVNNSNYFNDLETGPDSGDIYIATDKGLFVLDGNEVITKIDIPQFTALESKGIDPDVQAIEIHPQNEDIIYIASPNTEILKSVDRGLSWTEISNGIPTLGFVILKVDPIDDVIYAESPGGGVWKGDFSGKTPLLITTKSLFNGEVGAFMAHSLRRMVE